LVKKKTKQTNSFKNLRIVPCGGGFGKLSAPPVNEAVCQMEMKGPFITMLGFVWDLKIKLSGNAANTKWRCLFSN
jgi:hypothetical protein